MAVLSRCKSTVFLLTLYMREGISVAVLRILHPHYVQETNKMCQCAMKAIA
jgi:hypothetical protein